MLKVKMQKVKKNLPFDVKDKRRSKEKERK